MNIGKLPNSLLKSLILDKIDNSRTDISLQPKIGEDCSAVNFGDQLCVLSTDPITGSSKEVGRLAVQISCNDIASSGVEPIGLMITILAPVWATENDIENIMSQITKTSKLYNVDILGGHTEVTSAVTRFVINSTAVGKSTKDKIIKSSGAKIGDTVIMTKFAGLEGTAIIAYEKEDELKSTFDKVFIDSAQNMMQSISVVEEGLLGGKFGVNSMHDVTEGGILGALWEVATASNVGIKITENKIPLMQETLKICTYYNINPLRLISSGSMLITTDRADQLLALLSEHQIYATIIGEITESKEKILIRQTGPEIIEEPISDELYKIIL